jgi:hypothetical protein
MDKRKAEFKRANPNICGSFIDKYLYNPETSDDRRCAILRFPGKGCEDLPTQYCTSQDNCAINSLNCVSLTEQEAMKYKEIFDIK